MRLLFAPKGQRLKAQKLSSRVSPEWSKSWIISNQERYLICRWKLSQTELELTKIPNARMLILDDQPKDADDTIAVFVKRIGTGPKRSPNRTGDVISNLFRREE